MKNIDDVRTNRVSLKNFWGFSLPPEDTFSHNAVLAFLIFMIGDIDKHSV